MIRLSISSWGRVSGFGVWVRVMCMNWVYWTGLYSSDAMSYCHLSTN